MSELRFLAISHSPIIMIRAQAPAEEPELLDHLRRGREMVEHFDPDLIVLFGTDHFAGFQLSLMPSFCIGLEDCEAVGDIGGFAGPLDVPRREARELLAHLREENFDPAVSYRMRVDHAFSQPLTRLFGRNDRYPVIPLFISVLTEPFHSFKRSRLFGEAVGRYAAASGKRVLLMGTGGLSHHPTRYYPLQGEGDPEVHAYQLDRERGGALDDAAWFKRLHDMHMEGAHMLIDGTRTREHIRLNPEYDRRFLKVLERGSLAEMDGLATAETVEKAGIGFMELHSWIAAAAAYGAGGADLPIRTVYAPTLEYGIGYGMAYSDR